MGFFFYKHLQLQSVNVIIFVKKKLPISTSKRDRSSPVQLLKWCIDLHRITIKLQAKKMSAVSFLTLTAHIKLTLMRVKMTVKQEDAAHQCNDVAF